MKPLGKSIRNEKPQPAPEPVPQEKPGVYSRVVLYFEDGTQKRGVWTGSRWWTEEGEVHPVRWEYPNIHRTKPTEMGTVARPS